MMANNSTQQMGFVLACVALPSVAVFGTRYMGKAASQTEAGMVMMEEPPQLMDYAEVDLSAFQKIDEHRIEGTIRSPFWHEPAPAKPLLNHLDLFGGEQTTEEDGLGGVVVSAILPHPTNPLAIINSKPHKVGDKIGGGWKLVAINGNQRTITLVHTTGDSQTIGLTKVR